MAIKVLVTSTSFGKLVKEPVKLLNKKAIRLSGMNWVDP